MKLAFLSLLFGLLSGTTFASEPAPTPPMPMPPPKPHIVPQQDFSQQGYAAALAQYGMQYANAMGQIAALQAQLAEARAQCEADKK